MTPIFIVIITIGYYTGTGLYGAMQEQPLGFGGFCQAYSIMFVIGIALWLGSYTPKPRWFDAVGAAAHIPVLFALVVFSETWQIVGNLWLLSAPIHVIAITAELIAFCWPSRKSPAKRSRG